MFSTGKINSYVSFPLDNLNMQPFVHSGEKNFFNLKSIFFYLLLTSNISQKKMSSEREFIIGRGKKKRRMPHTSKMSFRSIVL